MAAAGVYYVRYIAPYETTDDAFIESYVTFVSPRVSGPVVKLLATDNQRVKAGDVLLEIDPRDYQTLVDQANADLAAANSHVRQAEAQIVVDQAKADQQNAAIPAAQAIAERAEADRVRYEAVESQAVSRSQLDLAKTQASSAAAEVEVARNQAKAAAAQVELDRANVGDRARPGAAGADAAGTGAIAAFLHEGHRAAGRARHAPHGGAGRLRPNRPGAAGAGAGRLVGGGQFQGDAIGADASRPGGAASRWMPIRITNSRARWRASRPDRGRVFSLLPPENAVGNYVKVVQRVPVKIIFDEPMPDLSQFDLAPGMSVEPKVRVK